MSNRLVSQYFIMYFSLRVLMIENFLSYKNMDRIAQESCVCTDKKNVLPHLHDDFNKIDFIILHEPPGRTNVLIWKIRLPRKNINWSCQFLIDLNEMLFFSLSQGST